MPTRVARWVSDYPRLCEGHRDADGCAPKHTFFFPSEEYRPEHLDPLVALCAQGYGEIEIHLHHDNDTEANFRTSIARFCKVLHERHGALPRDPVTGEPTFAFIHGNWSLDNSRADGRWCGLNNELILLRELGCYADFTLPSAPSDTQTSTINSIYYSTDDPNAPKSHDTGTPVRVANIRSVSPGYLAAIGTPLRRGRDFTSGDNDSSLRVAIVDEAFAKHFWPSSDAIGRRFKHQGDTTSRQWITVVGVVPNIKHSRLDEPTDIQVYEVHAQATTWVNHVVVRTRGAPEGAIAELRRQVKALDPLVPVFEVHTLSSAVDESLATRRLTNTLLTAFSIAALLLAAIGIYGVISIAVSGRIREFGIRAALGATGGNVRSLVIRHAIVLALVGVGLGLAGALWATRFLQGLLYGVGRFDLVTFIGVAVALTTTAIVASYLPARRATRADPMLALRAE